MSGHGIFKVASTYGRFVFPNSGFKRPFGLAYIRQAAGTLEKINSMSRVAVNKLFNFVLFTSTGMSEVLCIGGIGTLNIIGMCVCVVSSRLVFFVHDAGPNVHGISRALTFDPYDTTWYSGTTATGRGTPLPQGPWRIPWEPPIPADL